MVANVAASIILLVIVAAMHGVAILVGKLRLDIAAMALAVALKHHQAAVVTVRQVVVKDLFPDPAVNVVDRCITMVIVAAEPIRQALVGLQAVGD